MLLRKLREYADRLELPPTLYREKPVRYIIELDGEGRPLGITDTADPSSPRTRRGAGRLAPDVQRAYAIRPLLLADKADYALGYASEDARRERAAACHATFVDQVRRCIEATAEPSVRMVLRFLEASPLERVRLPDDFDPGATLTFRVNGTFPIYLPSVQAFWQTENAPAHAERLQCVVCGETKPVLERLQEKIKGIPGGQTAGTALISANAEAFESYGLPASLVAPTCADCGERFTKALNDLLAGEGTSLRIGTKLVFVFWTRELVPYSFRGLIEHPQPEDVRELIDSVRSGRPADVDPSRFFCASLSGSGGRAVVRDWIDTTVGEVRANLARWFERQRIVDRDGRETGPLGLRRLARATVRDAKDVSPNVPRALLRSALTGTPVPHGLLFEAVRRNKAERGVKPERAALIKLVTLSHHPEWKEDRMVRLDPKNRDPAYLCGRLLAVLEQVQRAAMPGAAQTIVDRFFGTASTAPASVFGRLIRGAQPHLAKLERDRRGAYVALQRLLEEVLSGIDGYPRTLTLEEQGRFALGYYHQRAAGWGKRGAVDADDTEAERGDEKS